MIKMIALVHDLNDEKIFNCLSLFVKIKNGHLVRWPFFYLSISCVRLQLIFYQAHITVMVVLPETACIKTPGQL